MLAGIPKLDNTTPVGQWEDKVNNFLRDAQGSIASLQLTQQQVATLQCNRLADCLTQVQSGLPGLAGDSPASLIAALKAAMPTDGVALQQRLDQMEASRGGQKAEAIAGLIHKAHEQFRVPLPEVLERHQMFALKFDPQQSLYIKLDLRSKAARPALLMEPVSGSVPGV
jgi:hypothetical protein